MAALKEKLPLCVHVRVCECVLCVPDYPFQYKLFINADLNFLSYRKSETVMSVSHGADVSHRYYTELSHIFSMLYL